MAGSRGSDKYEKMKQMWLKEVTFPSRRRIKDDVVHQISDDLSDETQTTFRFSVLNTFLLTGGGSL